jgi:hypothetical protein
MAASIKITAFRDTAPCNVVVDRRFTHAYRLYHQGDPLMMQYAETYVYLGDNARHIPEGCHLYTHINSLN